MKVNDPPPERGSTEKRTPVAAEIVFTMTEQGVEFLDAVRHVHEIKAKRKRQPEIMPAAPFLPLIEDELQKALKEPAVPQQLRPPTARHLDFVDWVPGTSRKVLKKMIADQDAHIVDLHERGCLRAARFQIAATWGLIGWYLFKHLISGVARAIKGKFAG